MSFITNKSWKKNKMIQNKNRPKKFWFYISLINIREVKYILSACWPVGNCFLLRACVFSLKTKIITLCKRLFQVCLVWLCCIWSLYVRAYLLSHFSHVRFLATLWTVARQAPLSMEFSRQEYWVGCHALPSRGIFPIQGLNQCFLHLLHWCAGFLPITLPGKPTFNH